MVKLREELLEELLSLVRSLDPRVVVGPRIGEDASVIDSTGIRYIVTHTDPITGACEYLGWLAVVVPSNDVAVEGGVPRWCEIALLLPEGMDDDSLRKMFLQIKEASTDIGVSVIGGHTEYTPGITRPVAVSTCIGVTDHYVTTRGASPGELVVIVKSPAIEAALVLASDLRDKLLESGVSERDLRKIVFLRKELSLVREALLVRDLVSTMHDPTEGGVLQGVYEIARASNALIEVWLSEIKVRPEVKQVLEVFGVDPLRALSSGTLILTVRPENLDETLSRLRRVTDEVFIAGRVLEKTERPYVIVKEKERGREKYRIERQVPDEIMLLWSRLLKA